MLIASAILNMNHSAKETKDQEPRGDPDIGNLRAYSNSSSIPRSRSVVYATHRHAGHRPVLGETMSAKQGRRAPIACEPRVAGHVNLISA